MKRAIPAIAITLALAGSAFGKKNQLPERVYDHTGQMVSISGMTPSNVYIHVSANGVSVDSYCQVSETSVNCSDSPAYAGAIMRLDNGVKTIIPKYPKIVVLDGKIVPHDDTFSVTQLRGHGADVCIDEKFAEYPSSCDPLDILHRTAIGKANGTETPFQYRQAAGDNAGPMICVSFVLTDKKGEVKHHGEACYQ